MLSKKLSTPKRIWILLWLFPYQKCRQFSEKEELAVLRKENASDYILKNSMMVPITLFRNEGLQSPLNFASISIERNVNAKINENTGCD